MNAITKTFGAQAMTAGLMATMLLSGAGVVEAQTGTGAQTTSATSVSFTRDLTLGSSGADVIALQNWLISKGFAIPAGASGYFGAQTQAALAKYQASVGIAPAAGFFGPVTRAKVNAGGVVTTPTTPTTPSTNPLKGGEADLSNYDLTREQTSGSEGEDEVEIATAEFDVEDGDVRVERMDLVVEGANGSLNMQPWKYFDRIAILADGKEVAEKDVDSRADWSKSGNGYKLSLTGMKHIVRENDTAELTIVADVASNIDSADLAQTFTFRVADRGIRAVDGEGIQQYIGTASDTVSFGFDAEENGDLRIKENSNDPETSILVADTDKESGAYEVFVFDLENRDDVDTLITDLTVNVSGMNSGVLASDVIRRATLKIGRDSFDGDINASTISFEDMDLALDGDDSAEASLTVTLMRNATSTPIAFSVANAGIEAEGAKNGGDATVSGTATSETHTIAFAGVSVKPVSASRTVMTPGSDSASTYGTYSIKFSVTGVEDDAYIASTSAASGTVGALYSIGGNSFTGTESAILTSTARMENGFYLVREGKTETFTLTVTIDPSTAGTFDVRLGEIRFNDEASLSGSTTYSVGTGNGYRTDPAYIAN